MKKSLVLASVALGAICASEAANAQTIIRGGGDTSVSIAYRNLFDCASYQIFGPSADTPAGVTTPLSTSCIGIGPNFPHDAYLFLYAPVGSRVGKAGFVAHTASPGYYNNWTAKVSGNIPYADNTFAPTWPYASIQFAGSDILLLPSDVATYNTNSGPANWGNILFMPAVVMPVAISINPHGDSSHYPGYPWAVAPNTIKLSRKSLCGIFSGHITKWDNASITADNGVAVGSGQITVVHRSDGSGTNFLLTNALTEQCRTVYGPNNETDPTMTLYAFPWTDRGVATAQCPALPAVGSTFSNWPDDRPVLATDQCGRTISNPGGGVFVGAQGDSGVASTVATTYGAIGYNSVDLVQPIVPSGPQTAMLQSQYDIDNATGAYHLPTAWGAETAMAAVTPVFDDTTRANPLNWAAQGTVPNPALPGSYPIAGFSWFLFYQCYAATDVAAVIPHYINWHYSNALAASVLADHSMAVPPAPWVNEIQKLIATTSPIGHTGDGGVCNAKSGA
ncbi:substrate-binding domain-containing protein [Bradyrhizobium genosp. A]|uniref:substrate-binding domain-containing protein n=1 Tax=Bradyrhizobium genosp. A TaxID=83626 RepID=UPI003CF9D5A3